MNLYKNLLESLRTKVKTQINGSTRAKKKKKIIYYLPEEYDFLKKLYASKKHVELTPLPYFPLRIRFQTVNTCNASCLFCPNEKIRGIFPIQRLDFEVFKKVVNESLEYRVRRMTPFLMNEPFCDPELEKYLTYLNEIRRNYKKDYKITFVTNGFLMNKERALNTVECGVDNIQISIHSLKKENYEMIMKPLKLVQVLENIDQLIDLKSRFKVKHPSITIVIVVNKHNKDELNGMIDYWSKRKVKIKIASLENRGDLEITTKGINTGCWSPMNHCLHLFRQFHILSNGDVCLCCVDWERKHIIGNVVRQSVKEIWHGDKITEIRRKYLRKDLTGLHCEKCRIEYNE